MTALAFVAGLVGIWAALSFAMMGAWLTWRTTRNSGWVDTIWTFGLGAVGCLSALVPVFTAGLSLRIGLVATMAAVWSLRLGFHIARRSASIVDDPRYARLIRGWGADASRRMFWLLQKQAIVSIPLGMAMWLAAHNTRPALTPQDVVAIVVFMIAVAGEAIADEQLRRFRSDHANREAVCDQGLWRWSRHPNYFFEWLGWFAYPLVALDVTRAYPWGLAAWTAPICMYWLLVYVSGIPPLEDHMLERRGDAFSKYQVRTNEFFPGPRKFPKRRLV